jgi:subtilisin family serine protease
MRYLPWVALGLVVGLAFLIGLVSDTTFAEGPDDLPLRTPRAEEGYRSRSSAGSAASFVPGELLLMFNPETEQSQIDSVIAQYGATVLSVIPGLNVYHMKVAEEAVEAALESYQASPYVQAAQPNFIRSLNLVPNDRLYANGQAVRSTADQNDFQRWYLGPSLLDAEGAWDLTTGRPDVVIAIIDSGIKLDHPDLAANIWVNPGEVPGDGVDNDGNGKVDDVNGWDFARKGGGQDNDPNPDLGDGLDNDGNGAADDSAPHGTLVAGIAGAIGNNGVDIAGAAWNVKLMALKVFRDDGGAPDSAKLAAISYAVANGAHVINLSFGTDDVHCPTSDPITDAAITRAFNAGILVVVAAGNDNSNRPGTPDSCTHALAVGGSDHNSTDFFNFSGRPKDPGGRASFSNFSPFISVVAPGVSLVSIKVRTQADQNAGKGAKGTSFFGFEDGNSFTAPLVSGLAALIISRGKDLGLNLTPAQVRGLIENHTVDLPDDPNDSPNAGASWDGKGRVNFRASVSAFPAVTASPPTAGDAARYTFTFGVGAALPANTGEIRVTFDKDVRVPVTMSRSSVLISATAVTNPSGSVSSTAAGGQVVTVPFDPTFDVDPIDSRRRVVKLKVPDMNPGTTAASGGLGVQGVASGAIVTVTFTTGAGLVNATEAETSNMTIAACTAACSGTPAANNVIVITTASVFIKLELILSAADGERGSTVTATGKGYKDGTSVTVWRDANANGVRDSGETDLATATVGNDDRFSATFSISNPPFTPGKTGNRVNAVDGRNNRITVAAEVPSFELRGKVTVTPTSAAIGDAITIQFQDFDVGASIASANVNIAGIAVTVPPGTTTNANGAVTFTTAVPIGVPIGGQMLAVAGVCCTKGGGAPSTRQVNLTITTTISGTVTLQGRTPTLPVGVGHGIATVTMSPGNVTANVAMDGTFQLNNVQPGTFTVTASALGYLSAQKLNVQVGNSAVVLPAVQLLMGLVNGDDAVTGIDLSAMVQAFGSSPQDRVDGQGRFVDQNGDGAVTGIDLSGVVSNFGRTSPLPWE